MVEEPRKLFVRFARGALQPFVKRILVVEYTAPHADMHLPETGVIVAFPYRGECRLPNGRIVPSAAATGLCDRLRHHVHSRGNAVVVVVFSPGGAAAFLRPPVHQIANTTIALDELIGDRRGLSHLTERLARAPNHARRIQFVEEFLVARLHRERPDPIIRAAVAWIEHAGPEARINELVRHIGFSQSALERRFRQNVGVSPKRFASLIRLGRVARLRQSGATFTTIAQAAGYFDQAHLIHDFKRMSGMAPEAFFGHRTGD